jgi:hypothetical protein
MKCHLCDRTALYQAYDVATKGLVGFCCDHRVEAVQRSTRAAEIKANRSQLHSEFFESVVATKRFITAGKKNIHRADPNREKVRRDILKRPRHDR